MDIYETERQTIDLTDISAGGRILDIGGGGEGVISRRFGEAVVAIDRCKDELEETPDIGLKIVMDACDLGFLDGSFDHVTSFFTLMYMEDYELRKAVSEAYRVLKNGGALWLWDAVIAEPPKAGAFVIQLEVRLSPDEIITTGYGAEWRRPQSLGLIRGYCENAGFVAADCYKNENIFSARFIKHARSAIGM
jgi:ubiquinone/menaquinone biosynthesis C-methylase UbiE